MFKALKQSNLGFFEFFHRVFTYKDVGRMRATCPSACRSILTSAVVETRVLAIIMSTPMQITRLCKFNRRGVAALHLQQASSSGAASSGDKPNIKLARPTPQGVKKSIEAGSIPIHPSRLPVTLSDIRCHINNIAKSFKWGLKKEDEWTFEAQQTLFAKLLKKQNTNKTSHKKKFAAIMNVDGEGTIPAIEDATLDDIDTDAAKKTDDREETEAKIQNDNIATADAAQIDDTVNTEDNANNGNNNQMNDDSSSSSSGSDIDSDSDSSATSAPPEVDYSQWESSWHDGFQQMIALHTEFGDTTKKQRVLNKLLKMIIKVKASVDNL